MGGRGTGSILLVAVVAAVIGLATLATVGLLPGQATNVAASRAGTSATATTFPFALGTGVPAPSVPPGAKVGAGSNAPPTTTTPAGAPSAPSTTATTAPPDDVPSQSSTTLAPVSESGSSGTTTTTAAASSSDTTPTTEARVTAPPPNVDTSDPTCSILQELLNEIDDADVRQAVRDEMRQSGCL